MSAKRDNEHEARVLALRARCRASRSPNAQAPVVQATIIMHLYNANSRSVMTNIDNCTRYS